MSGPEGFVAVVSALSAGACLAGLAVMLGTPGGRRYAAAGAVPALDAPLWVVGPAIFAAIWGYPYEATAVAAVIAWFRLGGPGIVEFWGLRRMGVLAAVIAGACVWLGSNPIKSLVGDLWMDLFRAMGWDMPTQPCVAEFVGTPRPGSRLLLVGWLCLGVPMVEEMAMTGLLYPWLKGRLSRAGAAFFTALAFALMHRYPAGIPQFFLHGLLATWLFEVSGSLLPAMGMHAAWNSVVTVGLWLAYPCQPG